MATMIILIIYSMTSTSPQLKQIIQIVIGLKNDQKQISQPYPLHAYCLSVTEI